tara:strand:- start:38018 stop:38122 length:105 start_codon:yes stop_codon:yes gene_type:complete
MSSDGSITKLSDRIDPNQPLDEAGGLRSFYEPMI